MFPPITHSWTCRDCGKEISAAIDESDPNQTAVPPQECPGCQGKNFDGGPIMHKGPEGENPFIKY